MYLRIHHAGCLLLFIRIALRLCILWACAYSLITCYVLIYLSINYYYLSVKHLASFFVFLFFCFVSLFGCYMYFQQLVIVRISVIFPHFASNNFCLLSFVAAMLCSTSISHFNLLLKCVILGCISLSRASYITIFVKSIMQASFALKLVGKNHFLISSLKFMW